LTLSISQPPRWPHKAVRSVTLASHIIWEALSIGKTLYDEEKTLIIITHISWTWICILKTREVQDEEKRKIIYAYRILALYSLICNRLTCSVLTCSVLQGYCQSRA
jgi:hypothetical protein